MGRDVDVTIDLAQVCTTDLLEELRQRQGFDKVELKSLSIYELIELLEEQGCPREIIQRLREWDDSPVCNAQMLKQWKEFCGVS